MDKTERENWIKAGKIASQVREYGKSLIKPEASICEVIEKIEEKVYSLGAKLAFPAQVSINEIAAHYTPQSNETSVFKKGDLVKLDVGVQIEGAIGDTAVTINLGEKNKEMVTASEKALAEAIKIIKPGLKISEIGKVIEKTISSYGFKPIKNLTGHEIKLYEQHAGLTIPNFDDGDDTKLMKNQIIAIEPFATNGDGYIKEGKPSGIYKLTDPKNVRDNYSREILSYIIDEFKTLPFSKRQLIKIFGPVKTGFALRTLESQGIVSQYAQLPEASGGLVTQTEHTILVEDIPIVLTQ